MLSIKNLIFLAVAVTGSVIKRDAQQAQSDLDLINTDAKAVATAVNGYNGGGGSSSLLILKAHNKLLADVKTAADHVKASGPASEADSTATIAYIHDTLSPSIRTTLSALKSKKPLFSADGGAMVVKAGLQSLKSVTDSFSAAHVANAPQDKVAAAKANAAQIDADFSDAITFFS